jgi:hypothetical protein
LTACETPTATTSVSPECRQAKIIYSSCYGTCMSSARGGTIAAISRCGNICQSEIFRMNAVC